MALNQNYLKELEEVVDASENIMWIQKPNFKAYFANGFKLALGALIATIVFLSIGNASIENANFSNIFKLFLLLPAAVFLVQFTSRILSFSKTLYAYSDKRIIIRSGVWGSNFKTIDYDKIVEIDVTVSLVEKILNLGTIRFYTGGITTDENSIQKVYHKWECVPNPHEVFKQVKQISVDIKTDYNYPNALRPDTNPGYNTKYNRTK